MSSNRHFKTLELAKPEVIQASRAVSGAMIVVSSIEKLQLQVLPW